MPRKSDWVSDNVNVIEVSISGKIWDERKSIKWAILL